MLWRKSYEIGIPKIDLQHQELFRQVAALKDPVNKERVQQLLNFLQKYVVMHFSEEQVLQNIAKYPRAAAHKKIHQDFIVTFTELKREFEQTAHNLSFLMKLNSVLVNWLRDHITKEDREFADYYHRSQP